LSKLTDKLNARGFHNSWEFFVNEPYIAFYSAESRMCHPATGRIHKRDKKLSDAWYDYGAKSFSFSGREGKAQAFAEAQAWASNHFNIKEWARNPFGEWGDANFVKTRTAELLALPERGHSETK
jgi:hypothetical protein